MHVRIVTGAMDGAVNDKSGAIDLGIGVVGAVPVQVNLDQVVGRDLGIVQAKRVDQVVRFAAGAAGQAHRDVVEDEFRPAEPVEQAVAGCQLGAQFGFSGGHARLPIYGLVGLGRLAITLAQRADS